MCIVVKPQGISARTRPTPLPHRRDAKSVTQRNHLKGIHKPI